MSEGKIYFNCCNFTFMQSHDALMAWLDEAELPRPESTSSATFRHAVQCCDGSNVMALVLKGAGFCRVYRDRATPLAILYFANEEWCKVVRALCSLDHDACAGISGPASMYFEVTFGSPDDADKITWARLHAIDGTLLANSSCVSIM